MEAWTAPQVVALAVAFCLGLGGLGLRVSGYVNVPLGLSLVWIGAAGIVVTLSWAFFDPGIPWVLVMAGGVLAGALALPYVLRWRERRHRREESHQRAEETRRVREQSAPEIACWDAFYPTVGRVSTAYSRLRDAGPEEVEERWNELEAAVREAIAKAHRLLEGKDQKALSFLRPLERVALERAEPLQGWVAEHELRQWVLKQSAEYHGVRRRAGLPAPKRGS